MALLSHQTDFEGALSNLEEVITAICLHCRWLQLSPTLYANYSFVHGVAETEEFELLHMTDTTTAEDIFRVIVGVDWPCAVSLASDGAPSMRKIQVL